MRKAAGNNCRPGKMENRLKFAVGGTESQCKRGIEGTPQLEPAANPVVSTLLQCCNGMELLMSTISTGSFVTPPPVPQLVKREESISLV